MNLIFRKEEKYQLPKSNILFIKRKYDIINKDKFRTASIRIICFSVFFNLLPLKMFYKSIITLLPVLFCFCLKIITIVNVYWYFCFVFLSWNIFALPKIQVTWNCFERMIHRYRYYLIKKWFLHWEKRIYRTAFGGIYTFKNRLFWHVCNKDL